MKVVKEKRENGLREIERLKDKIAKMKEQHKLEMMNVSYCQNPESPLDTSVSTVDGYRFQTEPIQLETNWNEFMTE